MHIVVYFMSNLEYEKVENGWVVKSDPGEPGLGLKRWSVSKYEAKFLSNLFRGLTVLEIGTGLGVATNFIATNAKWVHTVDIDPWVKETIMPILLPNVTFCENIEKVSGKFDAAFIDGLHTYEQCKEDIEICKKMVKSGGIIVLHDLNMAPVTQAARESGTEFYQIVTGAGLGIGWNYG